MNLFYVWKNKDGETELITAELDGTILPGVTRDSVLSLAREMDDIKVTERVYKIEELLEAHAENRIIECFGTGTAAIVVPVKSLLYNGRVYDFPTKLGESGELSAKFYEKMNRIYYGEIEHPWSLVI